MKHDPKRTHKSTTSVKHRDVHLPDHALRRLHDDLQEKMLNPMLADVLKANGFTAKKREAPSIPTTSRGVPRVNIPVCELWCVTMPPGDPCVLTLPEAHILEEQTRGQSSVLLWHSEREKRLTASKFGDIVKRQAPVTDKFVRRMFSGTRSKTRYMVMGLENERSAIHRYKEKKDVDVFEVGLCVNPGAPMLGASPDGLVWDKDISEYGLVEVKTVARAMEEGVASLEEVIQRKMVKYLKDGSLDANHDHYFQIVGQLAITGLKWCDFVCDWGQDCFVQRIHFDDELWQNRMLPRLTAFYFENRMHQPTE